MPKLLARNQKMRKSSNHRLFNFGIPAFMSSTGLKTCPNAGVCAKYCYAKKGTYNFSNVKNAYEYRLNMTLKRVFVDVMNHEIQEVKPSHIRIHDSGDFYSIDYLYKWFDIMKLNSHIQFYAYTKQIHYFKDQGVLADMPTNFIPIFSFGGKKDNLINVSCDRHSKIFETLDDLLTEGYTNASDNDLIAIGTNNKIGLLSH